MIDKSVLNADSLLASEHWVVNHNIFFAQLKVLLPNVYL